MHLALLLGRVAAAAECTRSALDDELLLSLLDEHRLTIAADDDTPGLGRLRAAGATVHVSDKRHVHMPGGGMIDADEAVARWLAGQHATTPVDVVVAAPTHPVAGPVRAALPGVPWSVLAGDGPTGSAVRLGTDAAWLGAHVHELWLAASAVAGARTVCSPVAPAALGLRADGAVRWLADPAAPRLVERADGDLVVVAATGCGVADGPLLLDRLRDVVDLDGVGTVVVLVGEDLPGATAVGPTVAAGVPTTLDDRVLVVPTGRDSDAAAWLEAADALVLTEPGELLVPSIARHAARLPTVDLQGDAATAITRTMLTPTPAPDRTGPALVVWTSPDRVLAELQTLRSTSDVAAAVLHEPGALPVAQRLRDHARWLDLDVVVGGAPTPPWGMPDPGQLAPGAVALHRRTWHAVAPLMASAEGPIDLVRALTSARSATTHSLGITRVDDGSDTTYPSTTSWTVPLRHGPLTEIQVPAHLDRVEPHPSGRRTSRAAARREDGGGDVRSWARSAPWSDRVRLALPWSLGLADAIAAGEVPDDVAAWAKRHRVTERVRLALPWRWGLLPRAMEGRW